MGKPWQGIRKFFVRSEGRSGSPVSNLTSPEPWLLQAIGAMQSATGVRVTPLNAMGVAAVFACVRVISSTVSTLPLSLKQREGKRIVAATSHPLNDVISAVPNPEMTSTDWRAAQQANLSLRSNAYAQIVRNGYGDVIQLIPLENSQVLKYRDSANRIRYRVSDSAGGQVLSADEVLDLRTNSTNGLTGRPLTVAAQETIALAIALQNNAATFFGNGSRFPGILTVPTELTPEGAARLSASFAAQASGPNANKIPVLEDGVKYETASTNNKDSQFDESRLNQNLEICRLFGVPPHKIGILNSQPRANVEQDNLGFISDTIRPIVVLWEQAMNMKLLTADERRAGYFVSFDLDALLRGDLKTRVDAFSRGIGSGIWNPNEVRGKLDENPYEGGDTYFVPANFLNITRAASQDASAAAKTPPTKEEGETDNAKE